MLEVSERASCDLEIKIYFNKEKVIDQERLFMLQTILEKTEKPSWKDYLVALSAILKSH